MSEFATPIFNTARKYVTNKSKDFVAKKVKRALDYVERKAAETLKRTAKDIVDSVTSNKRRKIDMKSKIVNSRYSTAQRGRARTRKGYRKRKFSRALRSRRSYKGGLQRAMRKIALNAAETKRFQIGTGLNPFTGDLGVVTLAADNLSIFKLTNDINANNQYSGTRWYLKGLQISGQISNQSSRFRIGVRVFIFKDEVSGFNYETMPDFNETNLLWYNRNTGKGDGYFAIPEPYKHAPKLMKGQNAKMVWSKAYELDCNSDRSGGELTHNVSDAVTFNKYLKIEREMDVRQVTQTRQQCQYWMGVTWYKLDMEQTFVATLAERPNIAFTGIVYFKDV